MPGINIGNEGVAACKALAGSEDFRRLRAAISNVVRQQMQEVLEPIPSPNHRDFGCGFVAGVQAVWLAMESGVTGQQQNQVHKPGPKKD